MGSCLSVRRRRRVSPHGRRPSSTTVAPSKAYGTRYSKTERQLITTYLSHFDYRTRMTREQHDLTSWHWEMVFQNTDVATSNRSSSRRTASKLYQAFYEYLEIHNPELAPVFSAMGVNGNVLTHITAGMYPLLQAPPRVLDQYIQRLLAAHAGHVRPHYFDPLGQALIYAIEEVAGPMYWTTEIQEAWQYMFCQSSVLLLQHQLAAPDAASSPTIADLSSTNVRRNPNGRSARSVRSHRVSTLDPVSELEP